MLQHDKVWVNLCVLTIEIDRVLFSEVRILGDAVNLMTTNMVSVASRAACDARITSAIPQKGLLYVSTIGIKDTGHYW